MVYGITDGLNHRCSFKFDLKLVLTLKRETKIAADDILPFYFYLSKIIRLDFSCESSAKQWIRLKHQVDLIFHVNPLPSRGFT